MKKYDEMILGDGVTVTTDCGKTQRNNNVIVCGSSGSGKTMSFIEPKLLCTKNSSLIVTLSKRKLVELYTGMFRERGYHVLDLDFTDPVHSDTGYDPLQYLESWKDVSFLAQAIVMSEQKKQSSNADPYWDMCAVSLLSAVIAAAFVMDCYATMADVMDLFGKFRITDSSGGLISTTIDHVFEVIRGMDPMHYAVINWDSFRQLPIKTAACVYSTLNTVLDKIFPPEICAMMKKEKKVDFERLSSEKTVLFVSSSAVNPSMNLLINIFYSQIFKELFEIGERNENGRLDLPVQVVCDDFACGAKILNFEEYISIFREKGISVMMMLQSESQLRRIYGEDAAQTIINNADTYIYMGGMDLDTARAVSRRLDQPLEDILCMPVGKGVIFRRGERPVMAERYHILEDREYQKILRKKEKEGRKGHCPVFCIEYVGAGLVPVKEEVSFEYGTGNPEAQRKKAADNLQSSFQCSHEGKQILELSCGHGNGIAERLDPSRLMVTLRNGKQVSVETAFQVGKVFAPGRPYRNLFGAGDEKACEDIRLRTGEKVIGFEFDGERFPARPVKAFYFWLYMKGLNEDAELKEQVVQYDAFADITFDPRKMLTCPAEILAAFVAAHRNYTLNNTLSSFHKFLKGMFGVEMEKEQGRGESWKKQSPLLKVGDQIVHPKFGNGEVKEVSEDGGTNKVTLLFKGRRKTLDEDWVFRNCFLL